MKKSIYALVAGVYLLFVGLSMAYAAEGSSASVFWFQRI